MMSKDIPSCPECGERFENVFEATDHLLEDDEEFDPALILPDGHRLLIGSLLRCLYKYADKPEQIRSITQSTYMTLFTAEVNPGIIKNLIQDMVVESNMMELDDELKRLLERGE